MSKRGVVADMVGNELYAGDLVAYATRVGNRVRLSDAILIKVTARVSAGRLVPMLKIRPTGQDSGWGLGARKTLRSEWISAEHVRLIATEEERAQPHA